MASTPRSTQARARAETGSTAVELALVLPVLLLILFGIIEIANILRIQITLDSAVTTIARDAATHQTTQSSAEQYMNQEGLLPAVTQTGSQGAVPPVLTLSPATTATCKVTPCAPFVVTLSYTYKALTPMMEPFFDDLVLTASAKRASEPW
uniref:TadE-like protein n=1 Tax=Desulfovibrio sp. U5L TaxID=596152 RepID=I2Q3Z8_9BACT